MDRELARGGYRAITEALRQEIESGQILPGAFLPTERELQQTFGASRTTVRRALFQLVESGWAEAIPGRGVIATRGLRTATSRRIAFIDANSYVANMLRLRLEAQCGSKGYEIVHLGTAQGLRMEEALQRAVDGEFAAAVVWSYDGFPDPDVIAKATRTLPVIALDHRIEGGDCDLVTFDHEGAATAATAQLLRQGARRVGVIGMFDMLDITHSRFRGFLRAMFAHGRQPLPRDIICIATSGHDDADFVPLEAFLRQGDRPNALFVLQDHLAPAVIATAIRCGLRLPQDLRVATLGDEFEVTVDGVGLTSVAFDWEDLANQAFALLEQRLANLHRPPVTQLCGHRLIVRGLCGAPPSEYSSDAERLRGFREGGPMPRQAAHFSSPWTLKDR